MSDAELNSDDIALKLLRHLEWQDEGFSIVFFFADVGAADKIFSWLNERLIISGTQLQQKKVTDLFAEDPESFVEDFISQLSEISKNAGGLWYELHRYPSDKKWNDARRKFLARLNERRFLLESQLTRPLVVVLPADFRSDTRSIAPDIWHVRALSEELRAEILFSEGEEASDLFAEEEAVVLDTPAYLEWKRIQSNVKEKEISLNIALAAVKELIAAKRGPEAEGVATEAVSIASSRTQGFSQIIHGKQKQRSSEKHNNKNSGDRKNLNGSLRTALQAGNELFVSLLALGDAFEAQGKVEAAAVKFSEALALIRRLNANSDNNFLRKNLGVFLAKLGDFEMRRGRLAEAEQYLHESLSVLKAINVKDPKDKVNQRAIATSLLDLGNVLRRQGLLGEAIEVFNENAQVRRSLFKDSNSPVDLRQVAIALANVGRTELARGNTSNAEKYLAESLEIFRKLEIDSGATSKSLRDLVICLRTLGQISRSQGDLHRADVRFGEALDISMQLVERDGADSPALRDLLLSTQDVGAIAMRLGDVNRARQLCQKSVEIAKTVGDRNGWINAELSNYAAALTKLADVEKKAKNFDVAEKLLEESIAIGRDLVEKEKDSISLKRQLGNSIMDLAQVILNNDRERAERLYKEALEIQKSILGRERFPIHLRDCARSLIELASIAENNEDFPAAEHFSREAISIRRELTASSEKSSSSLRDLSVALSHLVYSLLKQKRLDEAEEACLEGLRIDRELVERLGETVSTLRDLKISYRTLAIIAFDKEDFDNVKDFHKEILHLDRKLVELQPEFFQPVDELAESLKEMAILLEETNGSAAEKLAVDEELAEVSAKLKSLKKDKKT